MVAERLAGMRTEYFLDTVLPALRGHLAIHSGELTELARQQGLSVPAGEPAARSTEWAVLLQELAGVEPLPDASPVELLPVVRDLTTIVEGSVAPVPWWQRIFGGGRPTRAAGNAEAERLLMLLDKLADGIALPPELVKPLIGRFSGALTSSEVRDLRTVLDALGRDGWRQLGAQGLHAGAWTTCFDVLDTATTAVISRNLGLVYDSGY